MCSFSDDSHSHKEKMVRRKAARQKVMANKKIERGLLIVHTGLGKGKSTAAFGMALRAIGHNLPVAIVQFIKGVWNSGERTVFERFPELVTIHAMGEGFTWETQDKERDIAAATRAWEKARMLIKEMQDGLLILDELNIVLRYNYLSIDDVLKELAVRSPSLHIIITGRHALLPLIEEADLVSEMVSVKHPFRAGVKAQRGIEF